VLTPGTLTEDELLPARAHNYLVALGRAETQLALAWADMSTGDFLVQEMADDGLETLLARLDPAELIYPQGFDLPDWFEASQICATEQAASLFDSTRARQALERFLSGCKSGRHGAFQPCHAVGRRGASWLS
jgi:DNA mismatch repair protein MutS